MTRVNRALLLRSRSARTMRSWSRLFTVSHIEVNRFDSHPAVSRVRLFLSFSSAEALVDLIDTWIRTARHCSTRLRCVQQFYLLCDRAWDPLVVSGRNNESFWDLDDLDSRFGGCR